MSRSASPAKFHQNVLKSGEIRNIWLLLKKWQFSREIKPIFGEFGDIWWVYIVNKDLKLAIFREIRRFWQLAMDFLESGEIRSKRPGNTEHNNLSKNGYLILVFFFHVKEKWWRLGNQKCKKGWECPGGSPFD